MNKKDQKQENDHQTFNCYTSQEMWQIMKENKPDSRRLLYKSLQGKIINFGKLIFRYLGDNSGKKNLPELDREINATIEEHNKGQYFLVFNIKYPEMPIDGEAAFDIKSGQSDYKNLDLEIILICEINADEFLLFANVLFKTKTGFEKFELLGRFLGKMPEGINYRKYPH